LGQEGFLKIGLDGFNLLYPFDFMVVLFFVKGRDFVKELAQLKLMIGVFDFVFHQKSLTLLCRCLEKIFIFPFENLDVIMGIFELETKGVGHFTECGILIKEPGVVLKGQFKLDSGIIGLKCVWQFAGDVGIPIVISSVTLV
jgi:hypothetical protein